jgi:short-subunit dehydrogenase
MDLTGHTALVTGAASGIGEALARLLARKGCNLALADINMTGLETVRDSLANTDVRISTHRIDMAQPAAPADLIDEVQTAHGKLSLVFNNAGVALGATFDRASEKDFDWVMQVNFAGPVRLTRAAMPLLEQAPEAGIVNISSLFGLLAPPGQTAYCASKFALRGFTEALRHELEASPITVLSVHPGGVRTNIASSAKISEGGDPEQDQKQLEELQKKLTLTPDKAAATIIAALERRKGRVLVGNDAWLLDKVQRQMPATYWKAVKNLF